MWPFSTIFFALWSLISGLFSITWNLLLLVFLLSVPLTNFLVWGSKTTPNVKLMYVSVFTLLMLGIMMIVEIKRDEPIEDLHRKFDPALTFYDNMKIQLSEAKIEDVASIDMGLDTCVDPEGNLIDLKKRLKHDKNWVLLEIPEEFLRKETVNTILEKGGFRSNNAFEYSAEDLRTERLNQIKLEDFKFLDLYLKKQRLSHSSGQPYGIFYFDLSQANEDSFDKYIRTVEEYQKGSLKEATILFTTSDNYMTNRLKGRPRSFRIDGLQKSAHSEML